MPRCNLMLEIPALQHFAHAVAGLLVHKIPEDYHASAGTVATRETVLEVSAYALLLALISGLSLPIGAYAGIKLSPVNDSVCAGMMAFGAGALLFAVTVEVYGHSLAEVQHGRMAVSEVLVSIFSSMLGAMIYLYANRCLEESVSHALPQHVLSDSEVGSEAASESSAPVAETQHSRMLSDATPLITPRGGSGATPGKFGSSYCAISRTVSMPTRLPSPGRIDWAGPIKVRPMALRNFATHRRASLVPERASDKDVSGLSVPGCSDDEIYEQKQQAKQVASALFLGLLLDGVPEGILMGFLAAERHLSPVLVISLFAANFPEAFSSSSLFVKGDFPTSHILAMWSGLMMLVGSLAGISCFLLLYTNPGFPHDEKLPMSMLFLIAFIEGLTGGAMLACISSVMLPESFERSRKDGLLVASSGFLCTAGFLTSVFLKTTLG